ncbi:leucine-rich repeat-containing protein 15-like [Chironomus tepperi]|uniref:leucine-rich repeat-containing protein 15-like n=1 Tax=Chironomus tepperi TaxID=113505 RepID=UPI00391F77B9
MNVKIKFLLIFLILKFSTAQKCSIVSGRPNEPESVLCQNVNSMNDIADEIKNTPAWLNVKIINKAPVVEFTNSAVNVPYLHLIQSLDLCRAGTLNFSDNGFTSYDSLRELDISNTGIKTFKNSWFTKKNIESLDISRNKMTELRRDNMKYFPKLKFFNASNNDLVFLEAHTFLDSKKIETIALTNNHIQSVHFENLDQLRTLNLKGNALNNIGGNYVRMPKLEFINLAENVIHGIGDRWLETLESLKYVNLSNNKIPHIGDWTFGGGEKTKLVELDLSYNAIGILYQSCFTHLPLLTFLDLCNNKIPEIYQKTFMKQTLLQTLYLDNNKIAKIHPNAFENNLQLRNLDLSVNKIKTFTAEYFGTKFGGNRLRKLNLAQNEISTVDANLFAILKNLVMLNLSSNKLKELSPDALKNNINLQELYLDDNEIEFLQPTFFKNFNALEDFSIQNNRISFIPDTTNLKKLQRISIGKNPLQCICMKEILIWARTNKCKFVNVKENIKNPDCVVIPETTCIKEQAKIENYGMYDRFLDGMPIEVGDRSSFAFEM